MNEECYRVMEVQSDGTWEMEVKAKSKVIRAKHSLAHDAAMRPTGRGDSGMIDDW